MASFETPAFFPVATRGSVKTLEPSDLKDAGIEGLLVNAYHLMLRPGGDAVMAAGGLHAFMGWKGVIITDSGGFQVMTLSGRVSDEGVEFSSPYDGSKVSLTPETSVETQELLGADFVVALDECPRLPAPPGVVERAAERTAAWARRSKNARKAAAIFGIVQGGTDLSLRAASAEALSAIGFDGYAIGGLSVGESRQETLRAVEVVVARLPENRVRYLMGVGDPPGVVEAVARGVDLFDSVLPTRLARHGTALTMYGKVSAKNASLARVDAPLDESCSCPSCCEYPAGYIRHLISVGDETGKRLLTRHNVWFVSDFMRELRSAINADRLEDFRAGVRDVWGDRRRA